MQFCSSELVRHLNMRLSLQWLCQHTCCTVLRWPVWQLDWSTIISKFCNCRKRSSICFDCPKFLFVECNRDEGINVAIQRAGVFLNFGPLEKLGASLSTFKALTTAIMSSSEVDSSTMRCLCELQNTIYLIYGCAQPLADLQINFAGHLESV